MHNSYIKVVPFIVSTTASSALIKQHAVDGSAVVRYSRSEDETKDPTKTLCRAHIGKPTESCG